MSKLFFKNLRYIIEHKKNVFIEGKKLNIGFWQLLKHDLSKFSKFEFKQYQQKFFGKKCSDCINFDLDKTENNNCKINKIPPADKCRKFRLPRNHKISSDFESAWLHHQKNNKHHWQYWLETKNEQKIATEMPLKYVKEMIADWNAMSRKFQDKNNTRKSTEKWFAKQRNITLNEKTRKIVMKYFETGNI